MTIRRDAELSKDGVTVYNTKLEKVDKYGRDAGSKDMESKLEFGGGSFKQISVDGEKAGFTASNTSVTLSNSDNKAQGSGLVDHGEPNVEYTYEKTDKGFVVKGDNFVNVLQMIDKHEADLGRNVSLIGMFLPILSKEELQTTTVSFNVPNGLVCIKVQGKDAFNCSLEIERIEKAQIVVTPVLLTVYEKIVTQAEAGQKEKAEQKKKEARDGKKKKST